MAKRGKPGAKRRARTAAGRSVAKRQRVRYGRSMTRTKTRERTYRAPNLGGISHSTTMIIRKPRYPRAIKLQSEPTTYNENDSLVITTTGGMGQQAVGKCINDASYQTLSGDHLGDLFNRSQLFEVAGTSPGNALTATQNSFKLIVDNVTTKYTITNFNGTPAIIDVYDVIAKQNSTSLTEMDPLDTWLLGLTSQRGTNVPANQPNLQTVGLVPTVSYNFNRYWKIVKRCHVELGPGEHHDHVVVHSPNRLIDLEMIQSKTSGDVQANTGAIRDLTQYTFIVARGTPVENGQGSGNVTLSSVRIGVVALRTTRVRAVSQNARTTSSTYRIGSGADTNEAYYNPGSGGIQIGPQIA